MCSPHHDAERRVVRADRGSARWRFAADSAQQVYIMWVCAMNYLELSVNNLNHHHPLGLGIMEY